jgi:hypothetical protein
MIYIGANPNAEKQRRCRMDMETLTRFFMWCTILNGALLLLWTPIALWGQDWVYRLHTRWFNIDRRTFSALFYAFLGVFKIFFIVFSLVPYIALLLLG